MLAVQFSVRPWRRLKQACPWPFVTLWFSCTFCILMLNNNLSAENKCSYSKHLAFNSSCADGCVAVGLCVHALPSEIHCRQTVMHISKDQGWMSVGFGLKRKAVQTMDSGQWIWQSRICYSHALRRKMPRSISLAGCNQQGERLNGANED